MAEHHDYVALEWVKGEIEETLKQAEQALEAYVESPEDGTRMRFCLTYIHQVHGTLQMVEFYGAALLAEEMEKVAQAIINDKVPQVKEAQEVLMQAILQLPGYLEHLQAGRDDVPVTLLPLLNDLRAACGESLLTETSLFSPNLLPLKSEGTFSFASANAREKLVRLREAYKLGLLGVIRNSGLDKSYATLAKACMHLEQLCGEAPLARLWWIAGAIVEGMSNDTIENSISVKTLLRQVEKEISRLVNEGDEGLNSPVQEELAKNLLYYIAKSNSESPSVRSIKQVFGLTAALPAEQDVNQALQGSVKSAMGSVVSALSEELANLKEQFDLFTRSSNYDAEKLSELGASFKQIADTLAVLGLGPQRKSLLEQYDKINSWVEQGVQPETAELMSIASDLLMVEVGLNASTSTQSKTEVPSDIPVDALNTAQAAVVKECRNGLEQVKDSIISYIASQWSSEELESVSQTLKSVEGALAMVPQLAQAAQILTQTREVIEQRLLPENSEDPSWEMMDSLADAVAGVDYYLERVTESAQDEGGSVLQVAAESIAAITGKPLDGFEEGAPFAGQEEVFDLEASIEEVPELEIDLEPVMNEAPSEEEVDESIDLDQVVDLDIPVLDAETEEPVTQDKESEETLDIPVLDSIEETEPEVELDLPEASEEPLISAIDVAEETDLEGGIGLDLPEPEELDEALDLDLGMASDDDLASMLTEELEEPSAEPVIESVAESTEESDDSDSMIDDEIIEIFIEEAEEVQETISEFLPQYKQDNDNTDAQTEVRRAFHTLKGSGRLVGAEQVGELAWKVENMLNRVIDQTIQASPDMFSLIDDVCEVLPALVAAFAKGQTADVDTQTLMDAADGLVEGKPYSSEPSNDAASLEVVEEATEVSEELTKLDELDELPAGDFDLSEESSESTDISSEDLESQLLDSLAGEIDLPDSELSIELEENEVPVVSDQDIQSSDDVITLDQDEASDLLDIFKSEAITHLDTLDGYIQQHLYQDNASLTDDVQRALHTLKGSAHMAAVTPIADLASHCERVVKEARAAHLMADQQLISQLKDASDWIRNALDGINENGSVVLDIPEEWLTSLQDTLSRLPSEVSVDADTSMAQDNLNASPDHQMMNIFLMEGMDILGDIEQILQQWRSEPNNSRFGADLEAEFATLAKAARMARVGKFSDVSETLGTLVSDITAKTGLPNERFFVEVDMGYEALVSMMDMLAAGQALPDLTDEVTNIEGLDRDALVDEPEAIDESSLAADSLLEEETELVAGDVAEDLLEGESPAESEFAQEADALDAEASMDYVEEELSLDELASDDDLAAFVDEFDEYGESQAVEEAADEETNELPEVEADNELEEEDSELVSIFLEEADDIVSHLDENLQQWSARPDEILPVHELQRAIHTLKGGARLSGIKPIGDLCHELENLYEGVSESRLQFSESLTDLLQRCHDAIATQVSDIHEGKEPSSYPDLEQNIIDHISGAVTPVDVVEETEEMAELTAAADQALSASVPEPLSSNVDAELVDIFLEEAEEILESITENLEQWADAQDDLAPVAELQRELHTLKGGARMAEISPVGDLGHELENLYEGLVNGMFTSSDSLIELLRACHDRLADMIDMVNKQHMPFAANDLIEAITSYCQSGEYDESVLSAAPQLMQTVAEDISGGEPDIEEIDISSVELPQEEPLPSIEEVALEVPEEESEEEPEFNLDASVESEELIEIPSIETEVNLLELEANLPEPEDEIAEALEELNVASDDQEPEFDLSALGLSALDAAALEVSDIFIEEAVELSEALDNACHAWTADPFSIHHKDEVLRVLHTLKGGAKLAKLDDLAESSHNLETHIEQAPESLDDVFFADLMERVDQIQRVIEGLGKEDAVNESDVMDALVEQSFELPDAEKDQDLADFEDAIVDAEESSLNGFNLSEEQLLDELTHLDEDEEAPEELTLGNEVEIEKIPAPEFGPSIREALVDQNAKAGQEAVKVSSDLLENLVNLAGETSISRGRLETEISDIGFTLEDMDMTVSRLRDQLKRLDIETQAQISYRTEMQQSHEYDDFDPLEMDRYTNMQQLSRALLESVTDILDLRSTLENKVRDSETLLLQQSRINTELQEGLMRTRMVPFSRLVPRLRRIVRQVAQELGKQVEFKVHNAEGEMDRTVLERMVAPLEHMLRNAVDHGIEMPDVRKKAGKKAKGTVELFVGREGGDVVLKLQDDGAGVNLEAVRNKAIERNLMKPDSDLTDHEVMQFIFSPGFSTAKKVTQISGRGVGMDVVNSEIKQLGGNVSIDSEYGNGSHFDVRLPFTVSVNRALMVKVGDDLYAVPLNTIEGIVRVSPYELEEFYKEGSDLPYSYAGKDYRMEYMGTLLNSGHKPKLQGQVLPLPVLLVRGAEHPIALQVDSLMGSREVVVKSLGAQFSTVDGVSGATILGDGSVVIILDLAALIRAEHARTLELEKEADVVESGSQEADSDRPLRVMVVDDSVTVRKVTSRVLQRQGYEVFTAKDGVDAIAKLQDERPDIMLLDIEMPRMDGFEVASHVRHNEQIKDLPIIMITSRTGEKHRERAMSIGVNHYMGKPFQESVLLETIDSLVGKPVAEGNR